MKKIIKTFIVLAIMFIMTMMFAGCKPYDKPELKKIEASQTAFLIPIVGNTANQASFDSEDLLNKAKVATKEVQIPHRWVSKGYMPWDGEYRASATLIVVERKPVTREWTEMENTGTSNKNEGITAESRESIGFMAKMNAAAQIDEQNATKFLYRYNNKSLEEIMDTEIRARIESRFVEECSKYPLADLLNNKDTVMKAVREDVMPYFAERGITVTMIGMKGEFTYLDASIQASINNKYKATQDAITQQTKNKTNIEKAEADKQAILIQSSTLDQQMKIKALENEAAAIAKWDGKMPLYTVGKDGTMVFGIPTN